MRDAAQPVSFLSPRFSQAAGGVLGADLVAKAPVTPDTMRAQVETEVARWQRLVESRGIERQ